MCFDHSTCTLLLGCSFLAGFVNGSKKLIKIFWMFSFSSPDEPNTTPSDPWPAYRPPLSTVYKELSPTMKNGHSLKAKQCQFWNSYLPKLATFTGKIVCSFSPPWLCDSIGVKWLQLSLKKTPHIMQLVQWFVNFEPQNNVGMLTRSNPYVSNHLEPKLKSGG